MTEKIGITFDDVVVACVTLKKQKRPIGPCNVRIVLGTGSMTTICKHLRYLALLRMRSGRSR